MILDYEIEINNRHQFRRDLRDEAKKTVDTTIRYAADEFLNEAKRYWPVDTGRSRAGLFTRVTGPIIGWYNRWDYAIWVERRWFPLRHFFTEARMNKVLQRVKRRLENDG